MYFWNTGKLVKDLRDDNVSESEFKNYYLASSLLMMVSIYLAMAAPPENLTMLFVEAIGSIGITVFGINFLFKYNGGENGSNFINKTLSLSLPLMIKVFLTSFIVGIVVAVMEEASISAQIVEIANLVFVLLIQIVFFWRLAIHIHQTTINVN